MVFLSSLGLLGFWVGCIINEEPEIKCICVILMGRFKKFRFFALLLCAIIIVILLTYYYTNPKIEPVKRIPDPNFPWSVNSSRDLADYVAPENQTVLINNAELCTSSKNISTGEPLILIVVFSAVANANARQAIRQTWMLRDRSQNEPFDIRTVFLLGRIMNDVIQSETLTESNKYGDIIQEEFVDSYLNLTLKSVMMLKWVKNYCPKATFVLKTDDDMFVNIRKLSDYLSRPYFQNRQDLIIGSLFRRHTPVRDGGSKWYVPEFMYDPKYYPNYVSGGGYVISGPLVPILFQSALQVPYFHFEDVYLTGLVAKKANAFLLDNTLFGFRKLPVDNPCLYRQMITTHGLSPNELRDIWRSVNNPLLDCPSAHWLKLIIIFLVLSVLLGACIVFKCCRLRRDKTAISQIN